MSDDEEYYYGEEVSDGDHQDDEGGDDEIFFQQDTEDFAVLHGGSSSSTRKPEAFTREEIRERMQKEVAELAEGICSSPQKAHLLLRHFNWNVAKATSFYNDDPDRNGKLAGVGGYEDDGSLVVGKAGGDVIECGACWDDVAPDHAARLAGCEGGSHWFCIPCWKRGLQFQLDNQGVRCVNATCLTAKCPYKCSSKVFEQVFGFGLSGGASALSKNSQWKRYQRFLLDEFIVSQNEQFVFCPRPAGCALVVFHPRGKQLTSPDTIYEPEPKEKQNKLVVIPQSGDTQVKCNCDFEFCYLCQSEAHLPLSCIMLAEWLKKEKDDGETANYVVANCKNCPNPKCNKPTEKNGGCNWMKCYSCSHEWCWMCRKPHDHNLSTHKCVMESGEEQNEADREAAKTNLQRYVHFYERYRNHDHSKTLDSKVVKRVEKRIAADVSKTQCALSELDYLEDTANTLTNCRHVLKYSYAFGFYQQEGTSANALHENAQAQLEASTELLSQIIEDRSGMFGKREVVNRTSTCKQMLKNFTGHKERTYLLS